jgi:hypothetical protein
MLIVSATGDWTVNTPRVEYPAVRSVYELFGAADVLECVQIDAEHNYNRQSREAVYGFLARHLGGPGEKAERPASAVFWSGPSEPLREREIVPEPSEERRIFPDGAPLPDGAVQGSEAVAGRLKDTYRSHLETARPRDAATLETFRKTYGPAFRATLAARVPSTDDVAIEHRTAGEANGVTVEHFEIVERRSGARLPAALARPEPSTGVPALVVHPQGSIGRLLADLGPEQSRPLMAVDVFLTGSYLSPFGAAGRPTGETHFAGYNRVDAAWRVQDVLTAVAALRTLTQEETVDLFGHGEAGLWALLARAVAPELFRRVEADLGSCEWEDEADYLEQLYVPHLLRVGGLATAIALAAPAPLTLHLGPGARVPGWLSELYTALGAPDRLVVRPERGTLA